MASDTDGRTEVWTSSKAKEENGPAVGNIIHGGENASFVTAMTRTSIRWPPPSPPRLVPVPGRYWQHDASALVDVCLSSFLSSLGRTEKTHLTAATKESSEFERL